METEGFTKAQLQVLARKTESDLQPSACVGLNYVMLHSRGLADQSDIYIPDGIIDSTIIIYKPKDGSQGQMGLHCAEREAGKMKELLGTTKLINWQESLCFFHLPQHLVGVVEEVHATHVPKISLEKGHFDIFTYAYADTLDPISCPGGVKVCRLGKKGIELMLATCRYHSCINTEQFLKFVANVPSVGVYPDPLCQEPHEVVLETVRKAGDDEVPLTWVTLLDWGAMGMMNVGMANKQCTSDGGSQREGATENIMTLQGLAVDVCARLVAREGLKPLVAIEDQDVTLKQLFQGLPDWVSTHKVTWLWTSRK